MAHRRIVDKQDQVWDVWEVTTSASASRRILVQPDLQGGWLAFQCGEQRRRLAPLPIGWDELSDHALVALMDTAPPIEPRVMRPALK
jgi:hypothetical protein